MTSLRFTHTRLLVQNYHACFVFYRDVLGLEAGFGDESSGYADFQTGDVTLALFDRQEMVDALGDAGLPSGAGSADRLALIFVVDDVDQTVTELQRRGVRFVTEPTDHPEWGIRTAHFRDPDGNLIEIYASLTQG